MAAERSGWLGQELESLWLSAAGRSVMVIGGGVTALLLLLLYAVSVSKSLVLAACAWLLLFCLTTLAAALLSLSVGKTGPNPAYTYGLARAPVIAVFASSVLATLAAVFLVKEAAERLLEGEEHVVHTYFPLGAALTAGGLLLSTYGVKNEPLSHVLTAASSSWLQEHAADFCNGLCALVPGLSRFLLPRLNPLAILNATAVGVCGAVYAGMRSGYWWADCAGALALSLAITGSMLPLAKYTGRILLQTSPPHLVGQLERCRHEAERVEGVLELASRHFWQVDFARMAGTVGVRVRKDADEQAVLTKVTAIFAAVVQDLTVQITKDADVRRLAGSSAALTNPAAPGHGHGHSHEVHHHH